MFIADGSKPIIIYGREPHVARAANALTIDEAKALAQEERERRDERPVPGLDQTGSKQRAPGGAKPARLRS